MANTAQRSFVSGEISPGLWGRTDLAKYASGLRTCRNFTVKKEGGVYNRPGTEFVTETQTDSLVRLLPFAFNTEQTYVLEFTHHQMRVIRDGVVLGAPYALATPYDSADLATIQIVESADVVTIVHPNYPPADLRRLGDTNWTLTTITFAPGTPAPTGLNLTPSVGSPGTFIEWVVTAIDATTGAESFASDPVGIVSVVTGPRTVQWTAVTNAKSYNVYKGFSYDGALPIEFGFVGSTSITTFFDNESTPDFENRAPLARDPFVGAGNYPGAVGYYQQRLLLAGTTNAPETIYTSRSADFENFTTSDPVQDDMALTFTLASRQVNRIVHMIDSGGLFVFTSGGEWAVNGDGAGTLRPTDINARQIMEWGASAPVPIRINQRVLFVDASGAMVRDIASQPYVGYVSTDVSVFSSHLFDGHSIVDWAYAKTPDSIVWAVRDDGVLLGLTIVDEQQVLAWHRHDTDGVVENVCAIQEGSTYAVYLVVARTIAGSTRRYVERLAPRAFSSVQDAIFMDSTLSYDGRNKDAAKRMTLSGSISWAYDEQLTVTCSASEFVPGDVGNMIAFTDAEGRPLRVTINGYSSATVVTGFPNRTVPAELQNAATATWSRAVDTLSGLDHLEGKAVSVFADGFVVSSPNNPSINSVTVTGGSITLDQPYSYVHVGLPYISDLETLDIDSAEGPSLKEKKLNINKLIAMVYQSRGIFAGADAPGSWVNGDFVIDDSLTNLIEYKVRNHENWDEPVRLRTATIEIKILDQWSTHGHVFMRQVDPLPLAILAISPSGYIPSPSA